MLSRADELNNIGHGYHVEGKADIARVHYAGALILDPSHQSALCNLGALFMNGQLPAASEAISRRALTLYPDDLRIRANLAAALMNLGRQLEAREEFERVLVADPTMWGVWHNYGSSYYIDNEFARAELAYRECAKGLPDYIHNMSDLGLALLAQGEIQEGLKVYEIRWKLLAGSKAWETGIPEWKGEDLTDKRVLLHHEQGYGDSIMLARFVQKVADQAALVVLAVPAPLVRLFENNVAAEVIDWDNAAAMEAGRFDFHSPLLSVMRHLGIKSPSDCVSSFNLSRAIGDIKLPVGFRVGICWASGDHGPMLAARRRVVPLELFFPLCSDPNIQLVSLQLGASQADILHLGVESLIHDPMGRVHDFADTAEIISQLNAVISVDSAVAHLAGALCVPTIMLAPYTRCWRWWGTNQGTGWPWYDNFAIFSQTKVDDWKDPVRNALRYLERVTLAKEAA